VKSVKTIPCGSLVAPRLLSEAMAPAGVGWTCTTASGRTVPEVEHLGVTLDPASHRVTKEGREVTLSPKEFALLHLLMERPGNILSRPQIEERLYGWGEEVESNAVEVHIHSLRRKLGSDFIVNVRGVGYRVRPA